MGITTKTGDKGKTSLYSGERVSKDDARVEFCGTLDELCSFLGLARSLARDKETKSILESIQRDLFTIGAEAATTSRSGRMLKEKIGVLDVKRLEKIMKDLEDSRRFQECCFYLPGENPVSSALDIARTVTRRAERLLVSLRKKRLLRNDNCLIYLNRASDLLYLLARSHDRKPRRVRR